MHKITLNDGTVLDNLELNGNNYISNQVIENVVFEDNLDEITFFDGENTKTQQDMKLISNVVMDGKSWFILAEKTKEEKEKELLQARIADLEMLLLMQEGVI